MAPDTIDDLLFQIRRSPDRPDLHNSIGRLYQQQGKSSEAAKHYLTAARLFSNPNSPARNLNKALAILKKMVRDFPQSHDSYYLLADIYSEMENNEEAVGIYRSLSEIYRRDGKLLMAVSVFDKVISAMPESQEAWVHFARLNSEAGMPFHASQAYVRAASIEMGDPHAAQHVFRLAVEAAKLDPENDEARELIRNLSTADVSAELDYGPLIDIILDLDRNGQHEQSLELAHALAKSPVSAKVRRIVEEIRARHGLGEEENAEFARPQRSAHPAGVKVLVVDDEREIRLLLEQILKGEGFQVFTARDGEEGYEVFRRERPPVVVSDAMLPKLHGFELCRRIKEESNQAAKVMILTAVYKKYKYKGKVQKEFNVDEYLDKPFQITEFLETFYRLADQVKGTELQIVQPGKGTPEAETSTAPPLIMACVGPDKEMAARIENLCSKRTCRSKIVSDARDLFQAIAKEVPDILMLTERMPGMDPFLAAWLARNVMDLKGSTVVLVTKDPKLLDGEAGDFSHRIAAPLEASTLENILHLHQNQKIKQDRKERKRSFDEKRIEAVVRSKVERILKGQSQLEEYYNSRIRELESEIVELRRKLQGA